MRRRLLIAIAIALPIAGFLAWAHHHDTPLAAEAQADLVVIEKSKRQLTLFSQGNLLKQYHPRA